MIRITDQYFWNFVFGMFFLVLIVMGTIILDTETRIPFSELTWVDFTLITLSTFRLTRLFMYDQITKWFRDQFYDLRKAENGYVLEKPTTGPRRTIADLFSCPWCLGMWMAAMVTFFYLITSWVYYLAIFLSASAVAALLQLISTFIGVQTEKIKAETE
ncbi:hypothetical protein CO026_00035 [Candidatus Kaiserbacteria bacterium CG_4_9_14_0_2_um_filter_41_32]|uniref:DUF1360 domain-containing protein n=1 Tax=Candidatus Kaiserbacteria bacterium CG_4_9_14_0_2_um_filter_41_32 TaxID=1974601 RepID=A0A2M8FFS1_9BACT|nr:MAG: hypothetical protein CO026_00035 [Candidatus Kaiserbacteria bacterium CG_4_9_14_0_2_um_filter_41_32]